MLLLLLLLQAASKSLAAMSDAVWPPTSGKEAWLRGNLAKWLLQAGFEGNNGEVLRQVRPGTWAVDVPLPCLVTFGSFKHKQVDALIQSTPKPEHWKPAGIV